jgi:hypothetical protein
VATYFISGELFRRQSLCDTRMSKQPERRPSRRRAKDPGKTKDRALKFWLFFPTATLIVDLYPRMIEPLKPLPAKSEPPSSQRSAAFAKLRPFKLTEEQWAAIAALDPKLAAEARPQIESAIHSARVVRIWYSERSAEESEKMAGKRGEARQIHDALKRVTDRIKAFRWEETDKSGVIMGDRDFQQGMAGLRYILDYFKIASRKRVWPDYDKDYDWALYYLIRELDFIWKKQTEKPVRRSADGKGTRSEAYVVEVCKIALDPIEESTINDALKHYRTVRRLMKVPENVW